MREGGGGGEAGLTSEILILTKREGGGANITRQVLRDRPDRPTCAFFFEVNYENNFGSWEGTPSLSLSVANLYSSSSDCNPDNFPVIKIAKRRRGKYLGICWQSATRSSGLIVSSQTKIDWN